MPHLKQKNNTPTKKETIPLPVGYTETFNQKRYSKQTIKTDSKYFRDFIHYFKQGSNIGLIQKLLGHDNIKTTEIYTHISNHELKAIKDPADELFD